MTTSILSPIPDLSDNDYQTLKDFAREAPYDWRKMLEALIERAQEVDDIEADFEEDSQRLVELVEAVDDCLKELRLELETHKGKLPPGVAQSFTESLAALEEAAAEKPKSAPAVQVELITVPGAAP